MELGLFWVFRVACGHSWDSISLLGTLKVKSLLVMIFVIMQAAILNNTDSHKARQNIQEQVLVNNGVDLTLNRAIYKVSNCNARQNIRHTG